MGKGSRQQRQRQVKAVIYNVPSQYPTINAALKAVGPDGAGDLVSVASGVYVESIDSATITFPRGTATSPFVLRAVAGQTVAIKNTGELNLRLFDDAPFYATVEGFVFDGSNLLANSDQIALGSSTNGGNFVRLVGNQFINNMRTHAILCGRFSHNDEILNNVFHDGTWTYSLSGSAYTYPIYMEGSDNLVEGNELYNFPSWGIHAYSSDPPRPSRNIYRNNRIHDWGYGTDSRVSGILIYHGDANEVRLNNIWASNNREPIAVGSGAMNTILSGNVYAPPSGGEQPPEPPAATNFITVTTDKNVTITGKSVNIARDKQTKILVNGTIR